MAEDNFWRDGLFHHRSTEAWCFNCGTVSSDEHCHCTDDREPAGEPEWHPHDRELCAEVVRLRARVAELEARLEMDACFVLGPTGEMIREEIPPSERSFTGDGIDCRDATIKLQDEALDRARYLIVRLKEALEPFARYRPLEERDEEEASTLTLADVRRARDVLSEEHPQEPQGEAINPILPPLP